MNEIYAHFNAVFDIICQNTLFDFRIGSISLEGLQNIFHESTMEGKFQLPFVQLCIVGVFLLNGASVIAAATSFGKFFSAYCLGESGSMPGILS